MKIVTRAEWGAKPFTCSEALPPVDTLVVHYTASDADEQAAHANCAARVKGIQAFHMSSTPSDPTKPWCDIAYNFLVCKHGYIFEGRGWDRKSGATGDANSHTIAFCFLGDDTSGKDDVTFDGRSAFGQLMRTASSRLSGSQVAKGHRDFMSTTCPGDELYAWVKTGRWKTIGIARFRAELWALKKDEAGELRPALLSHSDSVPNTEAAKTLRRFTAAKSLRVVALTAARRRPQIRGVRV